MHFRALSAKKKPSVCVAKRMLRGRFVMGRYAYKKEGVPSKLSLYQAWLQDTLFWLQGIIGCWEGISMYQLTLGVDVSVAK